MASRVPVLLRTSALRLVRVPARAVFPASRQQLFSSANRRLNTEVADPTTILKDIDPGSAALHVAEKNDIKDPVLLCNTAWQRVVSKMGGVSNMIFPREIVWLAGAPGAGKGTMAKFIMHERDIPDIFEVSSLLSSPEMKARKAAGILIGDLEVVEAVLQELVQPKYRHGVVVDGFPRTVVQAQFIHLLYETITKLALKFKSDPALGTLMRRPKFSICVLYVPEEESVRRQLRRGTELAVANQMVADTGIGRKQELRATDMSADAARTRYKVFREEVFASLSSIKDKFHFTFINADASPEVVQKRILHEFSYQSSLDLHESSYEVVCRVPAASDIIRMARSRMVSRLNAYASDHPDTFRAVVDMISADFVHIIERQALAGSAVIRSQNPLLDNGLAVNMVLDVLSERGFTVTLDVVRLHVPVSVTADPVRDIVTRLDKAFVFHIKFPKPEIRRNET